MPTIDLNIIELVFLEALLKETMKELKKKPDDPAFRDAIKNVLKKTTHAIKHS